MAKDGPLAMRSCRKESLKTSQVILLPSKPGFGLNGNAMAACLYNKIHLISPLNVSKVKLGAPLF